MYAARAVQHQHWQGHVSHIIEKSMSEVGLTLWKQVPCTYPLPGWRQLQAGSGKSRRDRQPTQ